VRLDKLDAVLAQTATTIQDTALFAELLSLPNDGRYPARELPPKSVGRERWKRSCHKSRRWLADVRC
jgi:hypothetical protein